MINRIYFLSSLPLIAVDLEKVEAISEDWVMFGAGKISTGGEKNAHDLRKVWMAYHSEKSGDMSKKMEFLKTNLLLIITTAAESGNET